MATATGHQGTLSCRSSIDTSHTESNAHQGTISHANQQQNPTPFDFEPRLNIYDQLVHKGILFVLGFWAMGVGVIR